MARRPDTCVVCVHAIFTLLLWAGALALAIGGGFHNGGLDLHKLTWWVYCLLTLFFTVSLVGYWLRAAALAAHVGLYPTLLGLATMTVLFMNAWVIGDEGRVFSDDVRKTGGTFVLGNDLVHVLPLLYLCVYGWTHAHALARDYRHALVRQRLWRCSESARILAALVQTFSGALVALLYCATLNPYRQYRDFAVSVRTLVVLALLASCVPLTFVYYQYRQSRRRVAVTG